MIFPVFSSCWRKFPPLIGEQAFILPEKNLTAKPLRPYGDKNRGDRPVKARKEGVANCKISTRYGLRPFGQHQYLV
jgi:hypothetical protein